MSPHYKKKEEEEVKLIKEGEKRWREPTQPPLIKADPLYRSMLWKGVKEVYQCARCSACEDIEDDMKLHVLTHYPEEDRAVLLDKLTKEK